MIHVLIDSYECSTSRLNNLMDIYEILNKISEKAGVNGCSAAIMPPALVPYYYCKSGDDVGISAFVLLRGGHITIHTFPILGCYFFDMLYDGFVDVTAVETTLKRELPGDLFFSQVIDRDDLISEKMADMPAADFGPHWMIHAKYDKAPTIDKMFHILDTIPGKVGMHPITRPYVIPDKIKNPNYLSGIVVIAESHIAMHYDYKKGDVTMDIFSCKDVDRDKYKKMISSLFKDGYEDILIFRGKNHVRKKVEQIDKYEHFSAWQNNITTDD